MSDWIDVEEDCQVKIVPPDKCRDGQWELSVRWEGDASEADPCFYRDYPSLVENLRITLRNILGWELADKVFSRVEEAVAKVYNEWADYLAEQG